MIRKTALTAAVIAGLGMGGARAATFQMTFMDFPGAQNTTVQGTFDTSAVTGVITSGGTPFFGHAWTGTLVAVFTGGATAWNYSLATGALASGTYTFSLAPGQVAMGILFDWNVTTGIPVLNIVNADGSGVDIDGDGTLGTVIADGPFSAPMGFAGVAVSEVPVPAAVWLLGSGLLGLVGVARRHMAV